MNLKWVVHFDLNQGANTHRRIAHGVIDTEEAPKTVARKVLARVAHNRRRTFDRSELLVTIIGANERVLFSGYWGDLEVPDEP